MSTKSRGRVDLALPSCYASPHGPPVCPPFITSIRVWNGLPLMQHFSAAPWPRFLVWSSILGVVLLGAVGYGAWRAVPPAGFAHTFGTGVACVPPAILLFSMLFIVRGYAVADGVLYVRRLFTSSAIPMEGLLSAREDPQALRCARRIIGNAGLFSFTGLYRNQQIGRFRLYATNPARCVVLHWPERTVVITPASAALFIQYVHHVLPDLAGEPPPNPGLP